MKERPISNATFRGMVYFGLSIRAHCVACRHEHVLDLEALARRLGPDHGALHKDLVPKLRCRACGSKNVGIRIEGDGCRLNEDALREDWPD